MARTRRSGERPRATVGAPNGPTTSRCVYAGWPGLRTAALHLRQPAMPRVHSIILNGSGAIAAAPSSSSNIRNPRVGEGRSLSATNVGTAWSRAHPRTPAATTSPRRSGWAGCGHVQRDTNPVCFPQVENDADGAVRAGGAGARTAAPHHDHDTPRSPFNIPLGGLAAGQSTGPSRRRQVQRIRSATTFEWPAPRVDGRHRHQRRRHSRSGSTGSQFPQRCRCCVGPGWEFCGAEEFSDRGAAERGDRRRER